MPLGHKIVAVFPDIPNHTPASLEEGRGKGNTNKPYPLDFPAALHKIPLHLSFHASTSLQGRLGKQDYFFSPSSRKHATTRRLGIMSATGTNNKYLLSTHSVVHVLQTPCIYYLACLQGRYYYLHFSNWIIEPQRGWVTCPVQAVRGSTVQKNLNSGQL